MSAKDDAYGPDSIEILEWLEAVRRRPAMYVGNTGDGSGLHHLLFEIVANTIDEHLAGWARRLRVDVASDVITVEDDGRGIPTERMPENEESALEAIFTTPLAGPTSTGHYPHAHFTMAMHGVGLAAVNALSARMDVEVRRAGGIFRIAFERGKVVEPFARVGDANTTGTRIRYRPDPSIFASIAHDTALIRDRLGDLAWLHPMLEVRFGDVELPGRGGIAQWAGELAGSHPVFAGRATVERAAVDVAIAWGPSPEPLILAFVDAYRTEKGTHIAGLWRGLSRVAIELGFRVPPRELQRRLEPGLVAVLHVGLHDPSFGGPTRDQLLTPIAARAVRTAIVEATPRARAILAELVRGRLATLGTDG